MSFMEKTVMRSMALWEQCAETPFIRELKTGTLPPEAFRNYIVQDSIYLKHYARIYGKAIYHSTALRDIQIYYSMLSFVTDAESAVRLRWLDAFGLTDDDVELAEPLPENRDYIDFLLKIAAADDVCAILMAVLPCMMSYSYIFRKIAAEPDTAASRYWDFIQEYADGRYAEDCRLWGEFAERKCGGQPERKQEELAAVFERASALELAFWKMARRG